MHRHHSRDRTATAAAHAACQHLDRALRFQILCEFCGIHVVSLLVDVDELGQRSGLRNRFGSGDERVRHGDHNVAGLYSGGHQREPQSVGSAADGDRIAGLAESGECFLEILHHRSADESGGPQGFVKHFGQFLLKFDVRSDQIKKRNAIMRI